MAEGAEETLDDDIQAEAEPEAPEQPQGPGRGARIVAGLRRYFEPRLIRLAATVVAGLLLCASFPPYDLWYLSFLALALMAWVLIDQRTTPAGGFGYGMLAGLVFYVLLLPWISNFVGPVPWLMLAALEAFFVGVFGLTAVIVRRLPGWPLWFAALWVLIAVAVGLTVIGLPLTIVILVAITVWLIYRVARGWIALSGVKPVGV